MNGLTLLVLFAVFYSSHSYIWEGDEDPYLSEYFIDLQTENFFHFLAKFSELFLISCRNHISN